MRLRVTVPECGELFGIERQIGEADRRASLPPAEAAAAADPGSVFLLAVQPQPVDALPRVSHHEAHAGHQVQGAHRCVQLCQQA